jgi:hypothetical protein
VPKNVTEIVGLDLWLPFDMGCDATSAVEPALVFGIREHRSKTLLPILCSAAFSCQSSESLGGYIDLVGVAFNLRAVREAVSECFPIGILTPDESTDVKCTEVSRVYQAWLRARVGQVDLENHGIGFLSMLAAGGVAYIVCVL